VKKVTDPGLAKMFRKKGADPSNFSRARARLHASICKSVVPSAGELAVRKAPCRPANRSASIAATAAGPAIEVRLEPAADTGLTGAPHAGCHRSSCPRRTP
jgi:hypothetical protein